MLLVSDCHYSDGLGVSKSPELSFKQLVLVLRLETLIYSHSVVTSIKLMIKFI